MTATTTASTTSTASRTAAGLVITVNGIPTAHAGPDQDRNAGNTVTLDGSGSTDPDGDTLTYSWVQNGGPIVTITGATTASPTFTGPAGPATLTFELTVADGRGETDTDVVVITVNGIPTADAGPNQDVNAPATVTLDGTDSTDPDGDTLTFSWVQNSGPIVTMAGATTASPTFAAPAGPATLTFTLTVNDGRGGTDTDVVVITVNAPPVADAGDDQVVVAAAAVTLDGTASSDPDADPFTYAWAQTAGPVVTLTGASSGHPTFTAPPSGALTFELTVDDGRGGTDTDTVTITVDATPPSVVLTSNAGDPVNSSIPVTITFSEPVTGLTLGDVDVTNSTATGFTGSGATYAVTVVPDADGTVTVHLAAGAAADIPGNPSTGSNTLSRTYDATRPSVALSAPPGPVTGPFQVTGAFSEPINGLTIEDLGLAGCTASALAASRTGFSVLLTPSSSGTCSVSLPAGAVTDDATNTNVASATLSRVADLTAPAVPVLLVTRDDRCYSNGSAALGLRLQSGDASTTFSVGSSNTSLLPESGLLLTGLGDGDRALRLELKPDRRESGVALVTITATNEDGTARLVIRVVVGTNGSDHLRGSRLTDVMLGHRGADVAEGRGGRDLLCGGAGPDTLSGGGKSDVVHGQKGDDSLDGGPGNDVLVGGPGDDTLAGGSGTDNFVPRELLTSLF